MQKLDVIDRGAAPEEYSATLKVQMKLRDERISDPELDEMLVLVEHQPVYTVGRSEPFQPVSVPGKRDIPWVEIGRGGQATYHGPGQLVAYPIFNLERHGKDVHVYLRKIEGVILLCLKRFGIEGFRREGLTGVWVKDTSDNWRKIASIGIGVKRWISFHGLALNVSPDLSAFQAISPCGQQGEVMTSMAEYFLERDKVPPSMEQVKRALTAAFLKAFRLEPANDSVPLDMSFRPRWLQAKAPTTKPFAETLDVIKKLKLVTVCEEARCPNIGDCWSHHTATFMVMGEACTRRCGFCSVKDGFMGENLNPLDPLEPYRVGRAVAELGLKHVVITSVNRDDLPDMGAAHFHAVSAAIHRFAPECKIEFLIPDMKGKRELVESVLKGGLVDVLNHNIETVPRLYRRVRPGSSFKRSLDVLRYARELAPNLKTKSGLMVGLGEEKEEVLAVMDALREVDCSILTIGQYLQPTDKQLPIERYVKPEEFSAYREAGLARGFKHVESGPLVRSSYHAWEHTGETPAALPSVVAAFTPSAG